MDATLVGFQKEDGRKKSSRTSEFERRGSAHLEFLRSGTAPQRDMGTSGKRSSKKKRKP